VVFIAPTADASVDSHTYAMEPVPNEEIGRFVELAIRLPFITRTTGEWQTPPKSEGKIVQN